MAESSHARENADWRESDELASVYLPAISLVDAACPWATSAGPYTFRKGEHMKNSVAFIVSVTIALSGCITATLILAGCGASQFGHGGYMGSVCDANIAKLGPDTYSAEGECGVSSEIHDAGVFCSRYTPSREVLVTNVGVHRQNGSTPTIFKCLPPGEAKAPNYQQAPNVIIQDNRH